MVICQPARASRLTGFAVCLIFTVHAPGQGKVKTQPDDIDLGTLRQDTRVESNFLVWWHGKAKANEPMKVESPTFARVIRRKHEEHPHHGLFTRVWFTITTKNAGALEGSFSVVRDGKTARVPVQAVVLPRSPLSTRVLVASTPFDAYSSSHSSKFAAWRSVVRTGKLEVHYLNARAKGHSLSVDLLQRVDVVFVGASGLLRLTEGDVRLLLGFVSGGGRLVVAADRFFRGSVKKANELLVPFGLEMDDEEPPFGAKFEVADDDIVEHALTVKVEMIKVHRPTPTRIVDPERAQRIVKLFPKRAFIALSRTESGGEVVALGTSVWWAWVAETPGNTRLLRNLLTRRRDRTR